MRNPLPIVYAITLGLLMLPFAYLGYRMATARAKSVSARRLAEAAVFSAQFMVAFVVVELIWVRFVGTPKALWSAILELGLYVVGIALVMKGTDRIIRFVNGGVHRKVGYFIVTAFAAVFMQLLIERFVLVVYDLEDKGLNTQHSQRIGRIGSTLGPQIGLASHLGYYVLKPVRGSVVTIVTERSSSVPLDWQQSVPEQFHFTGSGPLGLERGMGLYVSRVVGLPGEAVVLGRGGVTVNGTPLSEPYVRNETTGSGRLSMRLGGTDYLLAEDVRTDQNVSTDFLPYLIVNERQIQSRQFFIVWPFSSFGLVHAPPYNIPNPSIWNVRISQRWLEKLVKM